jgi:2,3-dihydroxybenzoate-AMP ligase
MSTDQGAPLDFTEWPGDVAALYRDRGYWAGETFAGLLRRQAHTFGDKTAVLDDRRSLSYRELDRESDRLARGLLSIGIGRGDRVIMQLPNRIEFIELWFALQKVGAAPIHGQPAYRRSEIGHLATIAAPAAYVIPDVHAQFDHRELAASVVEEYPGIAHVIVVGGRGDRTAFSELESLRVDGPSDPVDHAVAPEDVAVLLLSGGTTGAPKLIPRTHDDYGYNSRMSGLRAGMGDDTVYLGVLPIAFNFTFNCPGVLGALTSGGTVVLAADADPEYCFGLVETYGVTHTSITPQLAPPWIEEAEFTTRDISSLAVIQIGGTRLADDVARGVESGLGCTLQQSLGMAEGLHCMTALSDPEDIRCTTQGFPVSPADEIRVVDPDGNDVEPGEAGELIVRGPYTLRGYFRAPEHNSTSFTPDGYYRTGDQVRLLATGHVVVVGRIKDQIGRGGEKIAALEVEEHLLAHPAITAAALVAEPDDDLGERAAAYLVASDSAPPTRRDLIEFLTDRGVAAYKFPDRVEYIDDMPLTALGKTDKKRLHKVSDVV